MISIIRENYTIQLDSWNNRGKADYNRGKADFYAE